MDRRKVLSTSGAAAVAALAGCATGGGASSAGAGSRTVFSVTQPMLPIAGTERDVSRCGASTASAATTRRIRARWAPTRRASRRSSFRSPPTRSRSSPVGTTVDHPYPPLTKNYHYEIELVAALNKGGRNIPIEQALDHVFGYTVGLDMTRRDLQRAMGDEKKPWEIGKSFDRSAPLGPLHRVPTVGHFTKGAIWLKVNGQSKQSADLKQMIWSVAEQIGKLSEAFELMPGDIIYSARRRTSDRSSRAT